MKLLLRLSYLGTNFCGYQVQGDKPTVQKALNDATRSLFSCDCDITGCSRTDSGVHANDFCVTVNKKGSNSLETSIDTERIPNALNVRLPEDISVKSAAFVDENFHPRYDVEFKEYVYLVYNGRTRDPFLSGRAMHFPRELSENDVVRMNEGAAFLVGTHDFSAFMASGSKVESTVRTMKYARVEKDGNIIKITLAADGFLYNMVRIITGTLLDVGVGKTEPRGVGDILASHDRTLAGMTAPACGLYLNSVVYPEGK